MSLDILKERFSGKPITSQYEDQIENKEKIIEKLEEETQNLSNQVFNLENEKNTILQELNKARRFEDGAFSIKEKNYVNELQSKDVVIKEGKQKTNSLYEQLDKKNEKLSYRNDIINNSLNIIKESKNKINYLSVKLNNSKNSKKELQLEIKKTYQDYIFKMDSLENDIKDRNNIINEQKKVLKNDNKKLQNLSNKLQELKVKNTNNEKVINDLDNKLKQNKNSLVVENNKFEKEINSKENTISELKSEVDILSNKVFALTETTQDNSILEKRLQEAEQFQNIVKNNKNNYQVVPQKKSKILNTDNLIFKLKEISKQKQGLKPLNWEQWIEIPESNYLNELNHNIALKLFTENNNLFSEDERKQHHTHTRLAEAPDTRLFPLLLRGLQGYYSTLNFSSATGKTDGVDVTLWEDLSRNKNHLRQTGTTFDGDNTDADGSSNVAEYNVGENSLLFKRQGEASTKDNYVFTNNIELGEFTTFFVINMTVDSTLHVHHLLMDLDEDYDIRILYNAANRFNAGILADDGTNDVTISLNINEGDSGYIAEGTKVLFTIRKKPYNSDDGYGQVEFYNNKTSIGTKNQYDEDILQKIQRLGRSNSSSGFKGHMYELAIYDRALSDSEIEIAQDYFINRRDIQV